MAIVLGVVGAAVGFMVGGPVGAEVGFMVGEAIGAMVFKPRGPQAADLKVQGSAYGRPIPILCGGAYRIAGNVIWAGTPHEHNVGDKKGPSQTGVSLSFAVGLCEGVIRGISRVWLDNKLVYDITNPNDGPTMRSSYTFGKKMQVYLGDELQQPNWLIQQYVGAGNAPAHRGLAYVVFNELDLTNYGNMIPSVSMEVVKDGVNVPQVKTVTNPALDTGAPFHYLPGSDEYWVADDMTGDSQQVYTAYDATYMTFKKSIQVPLYNDSQTPFWSGSYYDPANQWVFAVWNITGGVAGWAGVDHIYLFDRNGNILVDVLSPVPGTYPVVTSNLSGEMWLINGTTMYRVNQVNGALMNTYTTSLSFRWTGGTEQLAYDGAATICFVNPDFTSSTGFVMFDMLGGNFYNAGTYNGLSIQEMVYDTKRHCFWGLGQNYTTQTAQWLRLDFVATVITNMTLGPTVPWGCSDPAYDPKNDLLWCQYGVSGGSSGYSTGTIGVNPDTGAIAYQFDANLTPAVIGNGDPATRLIIDPVAGSWAAYIDFPGTPTQRYGGDFEIRQIDFIGMISPTYTTLDKVVQFICERATLSDSQFDVTDLAGQIVYGYCITNHSSMRDNLQPLMNVYFFDCDDGGLLTFVKRGKNPLVTIPFADIGGANGMAPMPNPITEAIQQEMELPRRVNFTYSGKNIDYQPGTQFGMRQATNSNLEEDFNNTIVLDDNDALGRAMTLLWERWVQSHTFDFVTSLKYLQYDPTDVVTLTGRDGTQYPVKLLKQQFDGKGLIKWSAVRDDPNIYPNGNFTVQGGLAAGLTKQTLPYSGPTNLMVLDVPPLADTDMVPGVYLAASGYESGWAGASVAATLTDGTLQASTKVMASSVMGYLTNVSSNWNGGNANFVDESTVLTVQLTTPGATLTSVTLNQMLAGANTCFIAGYEVLRFRDVVQIDAVTYQLTGLLRGVKGTRITTTFWSNSSFVLLDSSKYMPMILPVADLTNPNRVDFTPTQIGMLGGEPETPVSTFLYTGRVAPAAPYMVTAIKMSGSSTSDILVRWFRSANINETWLNRTDVPSDQKTEAYKITVYKADGSGTKFRELTVTGPFATQPIEWTYTAAMQATDGLTAGTQVEFLVTQLSDLGVAGYGGYTYFTR